ncbi:MAG: hypothetical protein VX246_14215 [Myxococcota bacterium]|nr:hypothetical protein [Myxococcota bacterium]
MSTTDIHTSSGRDREIWILRNDERQCAALVRLSGVTDPLVRSGSPADASFDATRGGRKVRLVVLGVSGDPEVELEYVHRNARHLGNARWIIVSNDRSDAELAVLFDALDATFIGPPAQAASLRSAIERALSETEARDSLRLRRYRDAISERFARWFGDLDLPELLRAMDPQLARVPIVVRGEPGTGRALLARYVHTFGGDAAGGQMPFIEIPCSEATRASDILRAIEISVGARYATLFLKNLEALKPPTVVELRNWIEFEFPPGTRCATQIRWVAALGPRESTSQADNGLLAVLSGLEVRLPPLRARNSSIEAFARDTALAQNDPERRRVRDFSADAIAALQAHSWPGNLRELENVIRRALADSGADPLEARHLDIAASPGSTREGLAEAWHEDAEDSLPDAEILTKDGDDYEEPVIELVASDLLDGDESGLPDNSTAEAHTEWIEGDDATALVMQWTENEAPSGPELSALPSIEVRPLPRGTAPRGGLVQGMQLQAQTELEPLFAEFVPEPEPEADPLLFARALDVICLEVQRPVETMPLLAETLQAENLPTQFADAFALEVSTNMSSARTVSGRLDALRPASGEATDVSHLLESLLAELRSEISQRGMLVLKELDRARPQARVPGGAIRLALRSLLTRLVARNRAGFTSDLHIASHSSRVAVMDTPSMRILIRHAFVPGEKPMPPSAGDDDLLIELALCDAVARSAGGTLSTSQPDTDQTVIVIDLPALD